METQIVKEWRLPTKKTRFTRTDKNNPFFYVVMLQKGRTRYLKIGTAENGIGARFGKVDYKKLDAIVYEPINLAYLRLGEKVGDAFKIGDSLK